MLVHDRNINLQLSIKKLKIDLSRKNRLCVEKGFLVDRWKPFVSIQCWLWSSDAIHFFPSRQKISLSSLFEWPRSGHSQVWGRQRGRRADHWIRLQVLERDGSHRCQGRHTAVEETTSRQTHQPRLPPGKIIFHYFSSNYRCLIMLAMLHQWFFLQ